MGNDPLKPPPIIRQSEGAGEKMLLSGFSFFHIFTNFFSYFGGCNSNAVDIVGEISKDWSLQTEAAARFLRSLSTAVNGKTAPVESREACGEELFPFTQVCNSVLFLIPQLVQ